MLRQHDIQDLVERLERDGSHRVLRKLEVAEGRTGVPFSGGETFIGVVVDVETTGLDVSRDVVIELAMRRFRFDKQGRMRSRPTPDTAPRGNWKIDSYANFNRLGIERM